MKVVVAAATVPVVETAPSPVPELAFRQTWNYGALTILSGLANCSDRRKVQNFILDTANQDVLKLL